MNIDDFIADHIDDVCLKVQQVGQVTGTLPTNRPAFIIKVCSDLS